MPDVCLDPLCRHTVWLPPPQQPPQPPPSPRSASAPTGSPAPTAARAPVPSTPTPRPGEAAVFSTLAALRRALGGLPRGSLEGVVAYPTLGTVDAGRTRGAQHAFLAARGALVRGSAPLPPDTRVLLLHRSGWERALAAAGDVAAAQGRVSPKGPQRATGIDHVDDGATVMRSGAWGLTQGQAAGEAVLRHALGDASLAVFHWRDRDGAHLRAFRYANYIVGVEETGAGTGRMLTRWEWREMSRADARRVLDLDRHATEVRR